MQILTFKSHPCCISSNAICQQRLAKQNQTHMTVLQNKNPSRSVDAAIPLRSAQTELLNTIELQHTTVSFSCSSSNAQSISTHAKHNSTASTKTRKSHLEPSVPLRAQIEQESTAKRGSLQPSRKRAYFSLQRMLRLPEKTQCLVQILTFSNRILDVISSNAICQQWLAKRNQTRKTILKNIYSTLLYSTLLFSSLLYGALRCSTSTSALLLLLLYSTLLYSTLLYSSLPYSSML